METLQLAQMLADLSDLNAAVCPSPALPTIATEHGRTCCDHVALGGGRALTSVPEQEPDAAAALVSANKAITQAVVAPDPSTLKAPEQRHHQRVASASAVASRTGSPSRFENFGRRLLTPPITRSNSAHGSIPGTPKKDVEVRASPVMPVALTRPPTCRII